MFDLKPGIDSEECSIKLLRKGTVSEHPFFCFHRTFSALTSIRHVASYLILLTDRSERLSQELQVAPSLGKHLVYFRVVRAFSPFPEFILFSGVVIL
jgi:hypothetical protein